MLFPSWSSSSSDIFWHQSTFSSSDPLLTPMGVLNSHFWGRHCRHTIHCFWTLGSESFEPDLFCCAVYTKVPLSNLQDPKQETLVCSSLSLPVLDGTRNILNSTLATPGWLRGCAWGPPKCYPVDGHGTTFLDTPGLPGEAYLLTSVG